MIFIDSGAFLGRLIGNDQNHEQAVAFWNELAGTAVPCYTSNMVLAEAFTLVARRASYPFAAAQCRELYSSDVLQILRPTRDDEAAALLDFQKYAEN